MRFGLNAARQRFGPQVRIGQHASAGRFDLGRRGRLADRLPFFQQALAGIAAGQAQHQTAREPDAEGA